MKNVFDEVREGCGALREKPGLSLERSQFLANVASMMKSGMDDVRTAAKEIIRKETITAVELDVPEEVLQQFLIDN